MAFKEARKSDSLRFTSARETLDALSEKRRNAPVRDAFSDEAPLPQYDPSEDLAYMPLFITAGAFFNAPFESRPDDVLCLGVSYGHFSEKLRTPERNSYELVVELNYKVQVNRFFFVQPDMQYVVHTAGGQYPSGMVLGLQFGASF